MFRQPFILSTTVFTVTDSNLFIFSRSSPDDFEYLFVILALSCFSDFDRSGQTRGDSKNVAIPFVLQGTVPITVKNINTAFIDNFYQLYSSGIACRKGSVNAFHKQRLKYFFLLSRLHNKSSTLWNRFAICNLNCDSFFDSHCRHLV